MRKVSRCFISLVLFILTTASSAEVVVEGGSSALVMGSSLSGKQTLESANGVFKFGFFSLGTTRLRYLGIWYNGNLPFTSVWVANRNKGVSDAAIFTCASDRHINLTDEGETVWSLGEMLRDAFALVLLDTGNLVIQSFNSTILWQSFQHPGNSFLPYMLLGHGLQLQSWLTPNNPAIGPYAILMGDSDNFVCVYNGSTIYYDSGPWDGEKFANMPEMINDYIFHYSFNSSGFEWNALSRLTFMLSKFMIGSDGIIRQQGYRNGDDSWQTIWVKPNNPCDVVRMCGPNSLCSNGEQPSCRCPSTGFKPVDEQEWEQNIFSHGCERKTPLNCDKDAFSDDGFIPINQTRFAPWSINNFISTTDSKKCADICLASCSCKGFYFEGYGHRNCSLISGDLYDGKWSSTVMGTFFFRVSAMDLAAPSGRNTCHTNLKIWVSLGAIVAMLVIIILVVVVAVPKWKPTAASNPESGLRAFSYAELQGATKNFREKLGGGGFGTVYKGSSGSLQFAVKKLDRLGENEKQFRAEVRTLGRIQHVNLVRLLGFCSENSHRLLVYEMAQNGSLDAHLFRDDTRAAALTWPIRYSIGLGAARGIAYLHEWCRERIIHCDIKPENILLDASYNVKVADFGLAKLVGRNFSHVLTTLRGTRGYLAPEWIAGMPITGKADVYSFGMTLLEIIRGQRNIDKDREYIPSNSKSIFFPILAARLVQRPSVDLACLLDTRLKGEADKNTLRRMTQCAIWCIQDNEDSRPSMVKVVQILEGLTNIDTPPIPLSLQYLVEPSRSNSQTII